METREGVSHGNTSANGANNRQWFVGSFMRTDWPTCDGNLQMKWGCHQAGEERISDQSTSDPEHRTMGILISGRVVYCFQGYEVTLEHQGDYVLWEPGVIHWWKILEDSVVQTIRWKK